MDRLSKSYPQEPHCINSGPTSVPSKVLGFSGESISMQVAPACGLLVSVRDATEARLINDLPVEVIDLKEPMLGPLAPCRASVWEETILGVPFAGKWSVALGEALEALRVASGVPSRAAFAKAGPSEICSKTDLVMLWRSLKKLLPTETELVAVAYADHEKARTLPVDAILESAIGEGFQTLLIDTYGKGEMSSATRLGADGLRRLAERAGERGLEIVLAGGLTLRDLDCLTGISIRRIALRGAVCNGGRQGSVHREKVNAWLDALGKVSKRRQDSCGEFPSVSKSPSV